jgi:hypothetical protein
MPSWIGYVWGGLAGVGVLLAWEGIKRLMDKQRPEPQRKAGLWFVNGGVVLIALSMAATLWLK